MISNNRILDRISNHIKSNIGLYFLVLIFFTIGVAAGAFTVKALDETQKQSLIKYLQGFFQILTSKNIDSSIILKQSIKNNIQTIFVIWVLGITVIGIPVTLLIVSIRGFIIGFTVGFLIDALGWKGLFFTTLVILPHNLIVIPSLIGISVISISFSIMIIKDRMAKRWTNHYWQKFFSYCILITALLIVTIAGSLIEAYIIPVFIKLISTYLTI